MAMAMAGGVGLCALLSVKPRAYNHGQGFPGISGRTTRGSAVAPRSLGNACLGASLFLGGEHGSLSRFVPRKCEQWHKRKATSTTTRATSDVPAYKGFPPMQQKPAWYWRILACIPYVMPLCESWMYAETAYNLHCFIEQFEFWTYPVLNLLGQLPSWFLLAYFFVAYLGIVRKNIWPHFFRFHVVTGMLLEILLQVLGTVNDWIPQSVYWGRIGAHFWLAVFFTYFLTTLESIRCALTGMYADVPFISDAAYMQIPYD